MGNEDILGLLMGLDDRIETIRENYQRAPFGWVGGKSRSIAFLMKHLPYRKIWVDVFGGSGVVTLNRKPSPVSDVFNDRYGGIVAFYRCIRDFDKMKALQERIELAVHSREEFLWCKSTWEECTDDVERAARWYYMIQCSFSTKGQAFARGTKSKQPIKFKSNLRLFDAIHYRFANVLVENLDWKVCTLDFDSSETVFYFDPPYLNTDSGIYDFKFKRSDHIDLMETIQRLEGFCAVSGMPNELYDSYPWSERIEFEVYHSVKAKGTKDGYAVGDQTEVLWIK